MTDSDPSAHQQTTSTAVSSVVDGDLASRNDERHSPWAVALVVTLATFMELLDTSIANVSLPQIAGNLGVSRHEGTWVLTSYLVANAVVIPMSSWAADRLGRKRFYLLCVALFTGASFLCGIAPSIEWLVVARVLQGLGGGGLVPTEQAILVDTFPLSQRGTALAIYGMTTVLAPALGPTLGGIITDNYSWRWIFLVNVPVGLISIVLVNRVLPGSRIAPANLLPLGRSSWTNIALLAIGLGLLEFVLERGEESEWFVSRTITVATIVAAGALALVARREWRSPRPIVDLKLLAHRNFAIASVLMLALSWTAFGVTVLMPQYLWALLGYTAKDAGLVVSPGGLLIFCLLPITGKLVSRLDPRVIISCGFMLVSGAAFFTARTLNMQLDFASAVQLRMLQCAGFSLLFVPIQMLAYAGLEKEKNNAAASVVNLARNLGASIGIAFLVTLLFRRRQFHQVFLAAHTTGSEPAFRLAMTNLELAFQEAGTSAFEAVHRSAGLLYMDLLKQAMQLAYLDAHLSIAVVAALGALLVWFARWPAPSRAAKTE